MRLLIATLFVSVFSSPHLASAQGIAVCESPEDQICTISAICEGNYAYYELKFGHHSVNEINVDAGQSTCLVTPDPAVTGPAHAKLVSQAQQVKDAGLCKLVLDNIN